MKKMVFIINFILALLITGILYGKYNEHSDEISSITVYMSYYKCLDAMPAFTINRFPESIPNYIFY